MAYQSLYRRFRPQTFAEVRGQQHLVAALRNAVREDRVGHAYLFSGPRGTGKTTTARILAKALNCTNVVDGEPCDECESCREIAEGASFDVFELDAASNNGVEAIRSLIDRASQGSPGRHKVYILDEVHMLSSGASNALLKTLEEPPPHVVFVLATTDPQKVLPTIKSRTQHYEVHLLDAAELVALVDDVATRAELDLPDGAVEWALRTGGGSARDTLSALDRVVALCAVPDEGDTVHELVEALCERDTGAALAAVEAGTAAGRAPRTIGEGLMARLRDVFLTSMGAELRRLRPEEREILADQAQRLGPRGATHALEVLGEAFVGIAEAPDPRIPLEIALVRLTRPEMDTSPAALLRRLEHLEQAIAAGATGAPATEAGRSSTGGATTTSALAATPPTSAPPTPSEGDEPGRTTTVAPAPGSGAGPGSGAAPGRGAADAARQALAARRGSGGDDAGRSTGTRRRGATAARERAVADGPPPVGRRSDDPDPSASSQGTPAEPPTSGASSQGTAAEPTTSGAERPATDAGDHAGPGSPADDAGSDALPSRDELVMAWGDTILGALPQRAKVRFAGGRFLDVVDGAAVFGLPNDVHRARCEDLRGEVEAALAEHFARPVRLRLVVDEGASAPRRPGDARPDDGAADAAPDDEDDVDLDDLVDADDAAADEVDRIAEVFGDVQIVEEEPR